jgi:hypothetical protein
MPEAEEVEEERAVRASATRTKRETASTEPVAGTPTMAPPVAEHLPGVSHIHVRVGVALIDLSISVGSDRGASYGGIHTSMPLE